MSFMHVSHTKRKADTENSSTKDDREEVANT